MSAGLSPPEGRRNTADIICIGAQRAMTSWLHRILSAHPQCWAFPDCEPLTSTNKEAQFWTRNRRRGIDWYRVLMTPPERRERQSLDITPDYALLDDKQIAECRALSPTAQVVYILRDPLARAVSALRVHTMWDTGHAAPDSLTLRLDDATRARMERARLWAHADMAANLRRWRKAYPDMLVLSYEALAGDSSRAAMDLLARLNLDPAELPDAVASQIAARARDRVWVAPTYRLDPDLVHFLHGATWRERQQAEGESALSFNEFRGILAAASEPGS